MFCWVTAIFSVWCWWKRIAFDVDGPWLVCLMVRASDSYGSAWYISVGVTSGTSGQWAMDIVTTAVKHNRPLSRCYITNRKQIDHIWNCSGRCTYKTFRGPNGELIGSILLPWSNIPPSSLHADGQVFLDTIPGSLDHIFRSVHSVWATLALRLLS